MACVWRSRRLGNELRPHPHRGAAAVTRWLALDAEFMFKPFPRRLLERFGPAGVVTFFAFLCACKRSPIPGRITFGSEIEARVLLGLEDLEFVDNHGEPWTLEDFWRFTGQQKQTRRTSRGRVRNVRATHWDVWQRPSEHARNRRSAQETPCVDIDLDSDLLPPEPQLSKKERQNRVRTLRVGMKA